MPNFSALWIVNCYERHLKSNSKVSSIPRHQHTMEHKKQVWHASFSFSCTVATSLQCYNADVLWKNAGTFVPKNFRSRERKFHRVELSLPGTKVPWNFRSLELSLPGTFAPRNESSMELSFPGNFAPWNFRSLPRTVALRVNFLIGLTIVNINVRCGREVFLITTVNK